MRAEIKVLKAKSSECNEFETSGTFSFLNFEVPNSFLSNDSRSGKINYDAMHNNTHHCIIVLFWSRHINCCLIRMSAHIRGRDNVGDIFYTLSLNFLLYVTLIIVFYMLVRFYFEEEVVHKNDSYHLVSTQDDDSDDKDIDTKVDTAADETELVELDKVDKLEPPPPSPKSNSFLNVNEWGEPDGTKQEVIQKALFCALGLNISFGIWGLVQERILTQTYDGILLLIN